MIANLKVFVRSLTLALTNIQVICLNQFTLKISG